MGELGGVSQSIIALLRRRLEWWREWRWWWCRRWGADRTWQLWAQLTCGVWICPNAATAGACLGGIRVCRLAGELRAVLGDLRVSCWQRHGPHDISAGL